MDIEIGGKKKANAGPGRLVEEKAYQGLVQGEEGGEEGPVHQIGKEDKGVSLLQVEDEDGRNEGHTLMYQFKLEKH